MYRRVKSEGSVVRKFPLSMRYLQAQDIQESRIGFVIRKRAGDAVFRNSLRRVLRECFWQVRTTLEKPVWIVFDVSDQAAQSTRASFRNNAEFLLQSLSKGAL
jgi:ribonuclease P protein component